MLLKLRGLIRCAGKKMLLMQSFFLAATKRLGALTQRNARHFSSKTQKGRRLARANMTACQTAKAHLQKRTLATYKYVGYVTIVKENAYNHT